MAGFVVSGFHTKPLADDLPNATRPRASSRGTGRTGLAPQPARPRRQTGAPIKPALSEALPDRTIAAEQLAQTCVGPSARWVAVFGFAARGTFSDLQRVQR